MDVEMAAPKIAWRSVLREVALYTPKRMGTMGMGAFALFPVTANLRKDSGLRGIVAGPARGPA